MITEEQMDLKREAQCVVYNTFAPSILKHYIHAKEKHPYFCDRMLHAWAECNIKELTRRALDDRRARIKAGEKDGNLMWNDVLDCEVWEVHEALVNGDTAAAIEECYDAISVLLRVIDVLEGRQQLGKVDCNEHKDN